jgi:hypothetical protein
MECDVVNFIHLAQLSGPCNRSTEIVWPVYKEAPGSVGLVNLNSEM